MKLRLTLCDMRGAYKHASPKYLQTYLDEYAFRYNDRHNGGMFDALLARATLS